MIQRIIQDERGLTLTEYALVVFFIGLSLVGVTGVMLPQIGDYLKRIIIMVSLPIP